MVTVLRRTNEARRFGYEYDVVEETAQNPGYGIRHLQVGLLFSIVLISYCIRSCLGIAIIAMTTKTTLNTDIEVYDDWTKQVQHFILSSFFFGYLATQFPAGVLATRVGGKPLISLALLVNAALCFALPWGTHIGGWKGLFFMRVLQGLFQGLVYPSLTSLLGKWVPLKERSRLCNSVHIAVPLGTVISMPVSGFLASSSLGWPSIFYLYGGVSLIIAGAWIYLGSASPRTCKMISEEERFYIEESLGQTEDQLHGSKKPLTPWSSIFTSVPLLALCVAHMGSNFGFLTLFLLTPSYLNDVHQINISQSGLLTSLPYLAMLSVSIVSSFVADHLVNKEVMALTDVRKLANTTGMFCPSVFLLIVCMIPPHNTLVAISLIIIIVGLTGALNVGILVNHIDLSPNFSGVMFGFSNMCANIVGLLAPNIAGLIISEQPSPSEWNTLFYIVAGVYFFTNLFYLIFGSAEIQSWNEPVYQEEKINDTVDMDLQT